MDWYTIVSEKIRMREDRAHRFETFVTWYLRFNGYFTVASFVVHAGADPSRISGGVVGNQTKVDTLALRSRYSRETSGIQFPTHGKPVNGAEGRFDVIFAEVKSGNSNSPNQTWRRQDPFRTSNTFSGTSDGTRMTRRLRQSLLPFNRSISFEEPHLRMRYIIFSDTVDQTWQKRGVQFITFGERTQFIAEERGQCWTQAGIGMRSIRYQWKELINKFFKVANDVDREPSVRQQEIRRILNTG